MMWQDHINGLFEFVSGVMIWLNVRELKKDKMVRGVNLYTQGFFTAWGFWNLYYYPFLSQWSSFLGGLVIVTGNVVWLSLAIYYNRRAT